MNDVSTLERPAASPPIDPRIRARRIEVRRHEGRRRLARLVELGLVAAVAALFVGALWTPLLDVDEVQVVGADRTGADAVRRAAAVDAGDPLVSVDLAAVGRRVAALPWVEEVSLARGVDGVVRVEVTERVPVATVSTGAEARLVDVTGRVLGPVGELPEAVLPAVTGVARVPDPGAHLGQGTSLALDIAAELAAHAPGIVASVSADGLVATLAGGGTVTFGDARSLDAKLRSLQTVLEQVDLACLAQIDLRLPGTPVLTREEGCP